jgi:serine/threonine-protein kinase
VGAVALLAVVIGGAVVAGTRSSAQQTPAVASAPPSATSSAPPSSAAPATPAGVPLDAAALVGRPVDQVRTQLTGLGLVPRLTAVTTSSVPVGQVTAVAPTGLLTAGQEVAVSYAVAPPATAPVTTAAPSPAPPTATRATPPTQQKPGKTHRKKGGDG